LNRGWLFQRYVAVRYQEIAMADTYFLT